MAIDVKLGIIKLQILQALPAPKPNPNPAVFVLTLTDGSLRTMINTSVSNTPMTLQTSFYPAILRYRPPSASVAIPDTVVFELTMQMDGEYKKFNFNMTMSRNVEERADTLALESPAIDISDGTATLQIVGLSWIEGITSQSITIPWHMGERAIRVVVKIGSSPLVAAECDTDSLIFGKDNPCGCEPICALLPITNFINCDVDIPPIPPPIEDCGIPPEPPEPIVNPVPPGEPGEPGEPSTGEPGPPGDDGTDGTDGEDGCTPQIFWSRTTVISDDCTIPFSMVVHPIGECSYWVNMIFYYCRHVQYGNDYCCDFVYCNGEWAPLTPSDVCDGITPPTGTGEDGEVKRKCNCPALSTTTAPCVSKLWVARVTLATLASIQEHGLAVVVTGRTSINPDLVYIGICSDDAPTFPTIGIWYNQTSACLALILGDPNFLQLEPDPVCCIAPPACTSTTTSGSTTTAAPTTTVASTTSGTTLPP